MALRQARLAICRNTACQPNGKGSAAEVEGFHPVQIMVWVWMESSAAPCFTNSMCFCAHELWWCNRWKMGSSWSKLSPLWYSAQLSMAVCQYGSPWMWKQRVLPSVPAVAGTAGGLRKDISLDSCSGPRFARFPCWFQARGWRRQPRQDQSYWNSRFRYFTLCDWRYFVEQNKRFEVYVFLSSWRGMESL